MFNLCKAGLKSNQPFVFDSALLPSIQLSAYESLQHLDMAKIHRYHQSVAWIDTQDNLLHPCYFHVLAFKQHIQLMLNHQFPFALLGIVHLRNQIIQHSALNVAAALKIEDIEFESKLANFARHTKGISFKIETKFMRKNQIIWQSVSEFLAVNAKVKTAKSRSEPFQLDNNMELVDSWHCGKSTGRNYARASGDFNPIHLSQLSAKLFGFKSAIAHGMWSKARCISALQANLPHVFSCQVNFVKPLFIPEDVKLWKTEGDPDGFVFQLLSADAGRCYLDGQITF